MARDGARYQRALVLASLRPYAQPPSWTYLRGLKGKEALPRLCAQGLAPPASIVQDYKHVSTVRIPGWRPHLGCDGPEPQTRLRQSATPSEAPGLKPQDD